MVRTNLRGVVLWLAVSVAAISVTPMVGAEGLERIKYNNPGLVVDLGVGLWAWPLPMDYDGDGDNDLVVSCPDMPYNGTYFFENLGGDAKFPVFKPAVRIASGPRNVRVSHIGKRAIVTTPGKWYPRFPAATYDEAETIPLAGAVHKPEKGIRANQWHSCDFDGDGALDLVVGVGDWSDYGWDDAFNAAGEWTRGPLHGYVYFVRNTGTTDKPKYARPVKIEAGGQPIDVFGMPSPCVADFDRDGDLDMICGEFLDRLTCFENVGTRIQPRYAAGRFLEHNGETIRMDLCMIVPTPIDWDQDGDVDLVIGQEDGRVALLENTGRTAGNAPAFLPPRFFRQEADEVKIGALATPYGFDWDGDGDEDIVCGDTAGYINFLENLDGGNPPKWAPPRYLEADGKVIRIQAGPNGSIQGPAEAKWGYTVLCVADWDHDGLPDIVVNSIWGKVLWYRNIGSRKSPKLAAARPIEVQWEGTPPKPAWNWWNPEGRQLATQWRTSPVVIDLNKDGLNDLVMLDHEGYLAFFERRRANGDLLLLPGKRIFMAEKESAFDSAHRVQKGGKPGGPLQLNVGRAGRSGRRKLAMADWDGDGRVDLLINSRNVNFLRNVSTEGGRFVFRDMGPVDSRVLAGHTTCPTLADWDRDGAPDLLVGAEDGCLYYLRNRHSQQPARALKDP